MARNSVCSSFFLMVGVALLSVLFVSHSSIGIGNVFFSAAEGEALSNPTPSIKDLQDKLEKSETCYKETKRKYDDIKTCYEESKTKVAEIQAKIDEVKSCLKDNCLLVYFIISLVGNAGLIIAIIAVICCLKAMCPCCPC